MGRAFNRFFYGMEGELSLILHRDMVGGGVLLPRNVQAASHLSLYVAFQRQPS
ncbi:hypothetical protein M5G07_04945 [Serratia symbiotica]|nr:hypothetical protein [Serratia symbiotica]